MSVEPIQPLLAFGLEMLLSGEGSGEVTGVSEVTSVSSDPPLNDHAVAGEPGRAVDLSATRFAI